MAIKDFLTRTGQWLKAHKRRFGNYHTELNDEGLISPQPAGEETASEQNTNENSRVIVKTVAAKEKPESIEKLQDGFNKLIGQLQGINEHLNRQVTQHEGLTRRIDQLPKLLESWPQVVQNQQQLTLELLEQLKMTAAKQQQFVEIVARIPTETAKQTDALGQIDHQLAAAADADAQMAESFNRFNETLDNLNDSTVTQKDSIMQMSKTFATSDRYLKYLMSRQNRRFFCIFMTAIGVCAAVILILTGIIIFLRS